MTEMVSKPWRELAERNKSNRMPTLFFASDVSEAGSRTGWWPTTHEILKVHPRLAAGTKKIYIQKHQQKSYSANGKNGKQIDEYKILIVILFR